MKPLYDGQENYYKKMLDLQEQLRKSEEERIRLEERFNLLVRESRNRHQECINRLRMRYVEYLEDQRTRDERNNRLLGSLNKIDSSLALMTAKTERLNSLRKQYEAYLLRTYGNQRAGGSVTADSGLESQNDQEIPASPIFSMKPLQPTAKSPYPEANYKPTTTTTTTTTTPTSNETANYSYKLPTFSWFNDDILKKPIVPSYLDVPYKFSCDVKAPESNDCLLKDFTVKPIKTTTTPTTDTVSTAERNLEQYLNQIKRMHKEVDKSELEHSADEAEQNTSGDLLNVSLSEDNLEPPSFDEERTRLRFARQTFANPRKSQDTEKTRTPPNSFDRNSDSPPKPIEELVKSPPKFPETITSFKDRLRQSYGKVNANEVKPTEEVKTDAVGSFKDRFSRVEFDKPTEVKILETEEKTKSPPKISDSFTSFKERLKRSEFANSHNQPQVTESKAADEPTKTPSFSESIGSLREKFNRTDFMNARNQQATPDSFEDAFAKLTRMKEPRRPVQEIPAPVINEELPTPPEDEVDKESVSTEHENDGIEDDYDDTVDIDSWMPDDVEPEPQEVKRKDDILDLPRRKLESIEEVDHTEDEEAEEEEEEEDEEEEVVKVNDTKDDGVLEEIEEEDNEEKAESTEIAEQAQKQEHLEALNVGYETQEQYENQQVVDPNAAYNAQQQYYEEDGTLKPEYQAASEYYEQSDPQQYQYSDDPNQQYTYDPNAQYAGYYEQYDPSQYDPSQYDPNQQYPQYDEATYAAYQQQQADPQDPQYDPNQAYDYSQAYVEPTDTNYQQPAEEKIDPVEPAVSQVDEPKKKKKDPIKAILDSDSESFIERNLSNTESDFDFN